MNIINPYRHEVSGGDLELLFFDDFLTMQPWGNSEVPDGWADLYTPDENNFMEENANGMRFVSEGTDWRVGIYTTRTSVGVTYLVTVDCYSFTNGEIWISDNFGTPWGFLTSGIHSNPVISADGLLAMSTGTAGGSIDAIIRSIKVEIIA